MLKQIAILAVCCSCSPNTFLDMRETELMLWARLVREAHRHIKGEEGLTYAQAFLEPKPLIADIYGKAAPPKKGLAQKVIDWAEKIRRLPDSGSFSSKRRVERRKRRQQ